MSLFNFCCIFSRPPRLILRFIFHFILIFHFTLSLFNFRSIFSRPPRLILRFIFHFIQYLISNLLPSLLQFTAQGTAHSVYSSCAWPQSVPQLAVSLQISRSPCLPPNTPHCLTDMLKCRSWTATLVRHVRMLSTEDRHWVIATDSDTIAANVTNSPDWLDLRHKTGISELFYPQKVTSIISLVNVL